MGTIVESRFQNGVGVPGNNTNNNVSFASAQSSKQSNNIYLVIAIIVAGLELVIIGILLVMTFSQEDKVCTIDDIVEEIEKDNSPSENRKIYEDFDFDDTEEPLLVYARIADGKGGNEDYRMLLGWAEGYISSFGGDLPKSDGVSSASATTFDNLDEGTMVRRILLNTESGCALFDFNMDFSILKKYSLMAGNCSEYDL